MLDLLDQLVNKSMVVAEETELGMRYSMLESIRQYAQEKLVDSKDNRKLRDRHLDFFLGESKQAYQDLLDLNPPGDWGRRFKPEADNFRSAWAWAAEQDLEKAIQFSASFSPGWSQVVPIVEVHRYQQSVLELAKSYPPYMAANITAENLHLLGQAYISAASVASGTRKNHLTIEYAKESLTFAEKSGDLETKAFANTFIKMGSAFSGGREIIQTWLDEDYDFIMRYGKEYHKAVCLAWWGSAKFLVSGEYTDESRRRWEQGMEMLRRSGDLWTQGSLLQVAADLELFQGKTDQAKRKAEQVQEIFLELGDKYAATPALSLLADLARQQGEFHEAMFLYRETIRAWRDSGRANASVRTMESLAYTMHAIAQEDDDEIRQVRLAYAAKLLGAADAIRQNINRPVSFVDKDEYDRERAEIKEEVGEGVFQNAWGEGGSLDLDQAVLLAIQDPYPS